MKILELSQTTEHHVDDACRLSQSRQPHVVTDLKLNSIIRLPFEVTPSIVVVSVFFLLVIYI